MEVSLLSELGARVAAMVLGALLPIGVKVEDTTRLYHGAGGGAPWHVRTAVRRALAARNATTQKGVATEKCE